MDSWVAGQGSVKTRSSQSVVRSLWIDYSFVDDQKASGMLSSRQPRINWLHLMTRNGMHSRVGLRKGTRANLLRQLSDATRSIAIECMTAENSRSIAGKLARVIQSLEKNIGLLEVNLKDEAAFEDFLSIFASDLVFPVTFYHEYHL